MIDVLGTFFVPNTSIDDLGRAVHEPPHRHQVKDVMSEEQSFVLRSPLLEPSSGIVPDIAADSPQ